MAEGSMKETFYDYYPATPEGLAGALEELGERVREGWRVSDVLSLPERFRVTYEREKQNG